MLGGADDASVDAPVECLRLATGRGNRSLEALEFLADVQRGALVLAGAAKERPRILRPLPKLTPMSSRNDFEHRHTSTVSVLFFRSKWAISFSLPLGGSFTSSTIPFVFSSVRASYLGGLGSGFFWARIGATHRDARSKARRSTV